MPFVKKRDVLSAIDVLGLKRNARSQWTGAARRCNVRVFDEQRTTKYKIKQREVSWDQAEQILGLYDAVTAPYFSDAHTIGPATDTEDDGTFKQRAARTGTPLPMEHLSLSNSDLDVLSETSEPESESALPVKMEEESRPYGQHRNRDPSEWNASVAPREADQEHAQEAQSLEQFDRQASKREAEALSRRLGFSASLKGIQSSGTMSEADDVDESIDLIASQDDWRKWTEYQATWEEFQTPVPSTSFIANQKSNKASTPHINQLRSLGDEFPEDSDASSTSSRGPQQPKKDGLWWWSCARATLEPTQPCKAMPLAFTTMRRVLISLTPMTTWMQMCQRNRWRTRKVRRTTTPKMRWNGRHEQVLSVLESNHPKFGPDRDVRQCWC